MNMIYWLAVGAFAVGTEAFMISAILPDISKDLEVSLQSVGGLIAIFSFSYAISSQILTALTAAFDRRKLLIGSMMAFAGTNAFAAMAPTYEALVVARVLLAFSAGKAACSTSQGSR
jgi:predicted MFS family arabinose efflux permease